MKIKYSALVSSASGKLNGSVAATNRGGAYLRNKGVVSNPQTVSQQANRSRFGSLSSQFRSLTPEQVTAWNNATQDFPYTDKFGDVRYLSGLSLYVQLNKNLADIGLPSISEPPVKQSFPAVIGVIAGITVDTSVSAIDLFVVTMQTDASDLTGYSMLVRATPPLSPSVSYVKNLFRNIGGLVGAVSGNISFTDSSGYTSVFGLPAVGQKVVFEVVLVSAISGEKSAPYIVNAIVEPAV